MARRYPNRPLITESAQGEVQADETLAVGAGPLMLGGLGVDLEASLDGWHVDANVNRLDRAGVQVGGLVAATLGPWGVEASAGWWFQAFSTGREDAGSVLAAGLTATPAAWWSVRADARRLASDSTHPEGRFTQWQALLSVAFSTTSSLAAPPGPALGVTRLADGRWQLATDAAGAARVDVVGDFNGWQVGATPMRPTTPAGRFVVELRLPTGQHGFMYVIDGSRFVTPAGVPTRDDGFGQQVGILRVPQEGRP
ncbi:MAG: hypothetical protein R3F43_13760 [bacterium]